MKVVQRIGIDWDNLNVQQVVLNLFNISRNKKVKNFQIWRTRKGYHILIFFKRNVAPLKALGLRALYDDDAQRISASLKRYALNDKNGVDILFDGKSSSDGSYFENYELKGLPELLRKFSKDFEKSEDVQKFVSDFIKNHLILEVQKKFFCSVPIYFRQAKDFETKLYRCVEDNERKASFFRQYSFLKEYDFLYVWQLASSKQAFAFGMDLKKKFEEVRTFFVSEKHFMFIKGVRNSRSVEEVEEKLLKQKHKPLREDIHDADKEVIEIMKSTI